MLDTNRQLVLAIDFNNTVFASYFGQGLINSHGVNINAVKGFFNKFRNLKETFDPDYIVLANDVSRATTFRRKLYPKYKSQRKTHDDDIMNQMKIVTQMVALLGYQMLGDETYEADDILGMVAKFNEDRGLETVIVSSDRDLYQLVTDHTFIVSPRDPNVVDKDYIMSMYGLRPDQWIDLKILQGDPSDFIPGIRGIGHKTALELMQEYGSVANIYDNIDKLKPGIAQKLMEGKPDLEITRTLVTILTDYNLINMSEEKLYRLEPYPDELMEVIDDIEAFSLKDMMTYALLPQINDKVKVYNKGDGEDVTSPNHKDSSLGVRG